MNYFVVSPSGETGSLQKTTAGEVRLETTGPGAMTLARALKARPGAGAFFFTPARADKFIRLFRNGFTAERHNRFNQIVWSFEVGKCQGLTLSQAMKMIRRAEVAA